MNLMTETVFLLATERDTASLGAALGDALRTGDVVLLNGPLGAGKTTLARAAIRRRCGAATVPSPTFTLVETYPGDDITISHFDFYRLEDPEEAWELGIEDALCDSASLIEWPERAPSALPADALSVTFEGDNGGRRAVVTAPPVWRDRLAKIADRIKNQPKDAS